MLVLYKFLYTLYKSNVLYNCTPTAKLSWCGENEAACFRISWSHCSLLDFCNVVFVSIKHRNNFKLTFLLANTHLSPITVGLSVSGITQPRGVGSQILLTINVTSSIDLSNVVLQVDLSKVSQEWNSTGIELDNGTSSWKVNLLANASVVLNIVIRAREVGYGKLAIEAKAIGYENWVSSVGTGGPVDYLGILVQDHEILVFEDINGVLPQIFPPDFNPNPPVTPGQLGNFTPPWPPQ